MLIRYVITPHFVIPDALLLQFALVVQNNYGRFKKLFIFACRGLGTQTVKTTRRLKAKETGELNFQNPDLFPWWRSSDHDAGD